MKRAFTVKNALAQCECTNTNIRVYLLPSSYRKFLTFVDDAGLFLSLAPRAANSRIFLGSCGCTPASVRSSAIILCGGEEKRGKRAGVEERGVEEGYGVLEGGNRPS